MADNIILINGQEIKLIPYGKCACGCGGITNIVKKNYPSLGYKEGQYFKFISGHNSKGENNHNWIGGRTNHTGGYINQYNKEHKRAHKGRILEHILVAEKVLGRPLKREERVHHIDENRKNNEEDNIYVFCSNSAHSKYHQRLKAFKLTGHWAWRQCYVCHQWDSPDNLFIDNKCQSAKHPDCRIYKTISQQKD